jgi:predicted ester cyclase
VRQGIAHCFVHENRVVEEWICRDELALIRQLGFDEIELAKKMAAREADSGAKHDPYGQGEVARLQGQTTPATMPPQPSDMDDIEYFVRKAIHEIWNWRFFNKINDYYVDNYKARTSTNRQLFGRGDLKAYVLGLLAAFGDASVTVDHVCWIPNQPNGYRVATRWLLQGTHDGPGVYGEPTGKRIRLWGISHHLIQNNQFVQEWTVFDEFALLKQLHWPESHQ